MSSTKQKISNAGSRLAALWPFLIAGSIFLVSNSSQIATPDLHLDKFEDKVQHFLVFGLFATAIIRIPGIHKMGWKGALLAIFLVSLYGALDEYHQSFTPHRYVEFDDWIADTSGAILAVTLYCNWRWYRKLLECRPKRNSTKSDAEIKTAAEVSP